MSDEQIVKLLTGQNGGMNRFQDGNEDRSNSSTTPSTPNSSHSSSVVDLIKERVASGMGPFFSLEFFPPRTPDGSSKLIAKLERLSQGAPLFCDITWHSASNTAEGNETPSMSIVSRVRREVGVEAILHITCMGLTKEKLVEYLERAKEMGIRNLLALRGDQLDGTAVDDFQYATDLVSFIRARYGNYFTIGVAGYPTGHPEAESYEADLIHLKEKVDAGAEFIITQLVFRSLDFIAFEQDCRNLGICVPILAGILPIQTYDSLRHIAKLSGQPVPHDILAVVESLRGDEEAIRKYGISQAVTLCREILRSGSTAGLHFFTLNREVSTMEILKELGLWRQSSSPLSAGRPSRPFPWQLADKTVEQSDKLLDNQLEALAALPR